MDENDNKGSRLGNLNILQFPMPNRPIPQLQLNSKTQEQFDQLRTHSEINRILDLLWKKDPYTYDHSHRVADFSQLIGSKLGLTAFERVELYLSALLHDVGKILTPDFVLKKPGPLTSDEFSMMRLHPEDSGKIISQIKDVAYLREAIESHHERIDGKGYPYGRKGNQIHYYSRIILVADTFDAMTSNRVYRNKLNLDRTYQELIDCSGTQFDPEAAKAFIAAHQELEEQKNQKKAA